MHFKKVKEVLTSDTVMAYFDSNKQTELVTDASPCGLSAILSQHTPGKTDRKIVAYVSKSLSPTECRYSQVEKEALAIVWAVERLHLYLYGAPFTLHTDCKPVELILNNNRSKPPARIERWNLRLQGYDFTTVHTKGIDNPSDFLSRHPSPQVDDQQSVSAEEFVAFLSHHAVPRAMTLSEIQQKTSSDPTLQKVAELIQSDDWPQISQITDEEINIDDLKSFSRIKDELTVSEDSSVILRGSRLIIPMALRQQALGIAHEGHQGLVKTKQLLREKIWFPGIDSAVKQLIDNCVTCQANGPENRPDPLQISPLPPEPWHTVHIDFCGPFPTGEYTLVVIDAYSRFPEVEVVSSTSAKSTIAKLQRIFATHGMPRVIRSDNGPPFTSYEFQAFMEECGINHRRITPLWPQANSEAENFMKPLTKAIRAAHLEKKNWKTEIHAFLLNYRATPHSTTGFAPAVLLFNRQIQTKLPQVHSNAEQEKDSAVRSKDTTAKEKMKENTDRKRRAKKSVIEIGDLILIRQRKENKFSTKFDPKPFRVTKVKGTMITSVRNGKYITRNVSQCKKIPDSESVQSDTDDEGENDDDDLDQLEETDNTPAALPVPDPPRYPRRQTHPFRRFGQNVYEL